MGVTCHQRDKRTAWSQTGSDEIHRRLDNAPSYYRVRGIGCQYFRDIYENYDPAIKTSEDSTAVALVSLDQGLRQSDLQASNDEHDCQSDLLRPRRLKFPECWHWYDQDDDADICMNGCIDPIQCVHVDARYMNILKRQDLR